MRRLILAGLFLAFLLASNDLVVVGEPKSVAPACSITVQRFARADAQERWQAYALAAVMNWMAGEEDTWVVLPWSASEWWNVSVQSQSEKVCAAFKVIFEEAGYKVR